MKLKYTRLTAEELKDNGKKYILENYRNPKLSLSSMSEYMALNASYLSTAFSRREGITVSNYILNLRLQKAEELILK